MNLPAPLEVSLCVLSSSSSGNCSLLSLRRGLEKCTLLIDAGLSPRRTRRHLREIGHGDERIDHILLTHLDIDHWHPGWMNDRPEGTTLHLHKRHRGRADRCGATTLHTQVFDGGPFEPVPGVRVQPLLVAHDDLGTAAFLFEFTESGRTLGYATDTGRPTQELCEHLQAVDVLAIESNYCPKMQLASNRPDFLKQRIMGGKGHLSNQESARAVARMAPRETVVLLHLSRQCNQPRVAQEAHVGHGASLVVSSPDAPTPWVQVVDPSKHRRGEVTTVLRPGTTLWNA